MHVHIFLSVVIACPVTESRIQIRIAQFTFAVLKQHTHHLRDVSATVIVIVGHDTVETGLPRFGKHGIEIVAFKFDHFCCRSPAIVAIVLFLADGQVCVEVDGHALLACSLGSDDYHTIRSASTVD